MTDEVKSERILILSTGEMVSVEGVAGGLLLFRKYSKEKQGGTLKDWKCYETFALGSEGVAVLKEFLGTSPASSDGTNKGDPKWLVSIRPEAGTTFEGCDVIDCCSQPTLREAREWAERQTRNLLEDGAQISRVSVTGTYSQQRFDLDPSSWGKPVGKGVWRGESTGDLLGLKTR